MRTPVLTLLGIICLAAAMSWARSARHRYRLLGRIDPETAPDAYTLAWSTFRKECHSSSLYGLLALASFVNAVTEGAWGALVFSLVATSVTALRRPSRTMMLFITPPVRRWSSTVVIVLASRQDLALLAVPRRAGDSLMSNQLL